jgi:alkylation response protein AidB-like acyl-CoA dehydrogenase
MSNYKAPVRDIQFVRNEVLDFDAHYRGLGLHEVNAELCDAILAEAAKFAENELAPLNRSGDEEGCRLTETGVQAPKGFKEAYAKYCEGGWPSLSAPEEFGGQGLPSSVDMMVGELMGQANQSWSMYPGLSGGARETIYAHGTNEQKTQYLPKLIEGAWTGTMCLTEPQCGSDLSSLRTKAEPLDDGSYRVTGTKIFISSGDHDLAENIVHIVLARLPDAPAGTKGISLFIVPKYLPNGDGVLGERNAVNCGALEHKMGIHGNATCVMNFDGAKAFLIGKENRGLACMFTFMNGARIGTAVQGITHAELALQGAWRYACEREAGRALSGIKNPDRPADLLIVHPDVRRMLLTIRAFAEGNRALAHYLIKYIDISAYSKDRDLVAKGEKILAMLTPIAKGFMTENGLEAANLGLQVFGGHGYIREWGMEQNVRDARISTLYEGTTGIQSMDLLARKVMGSGGELLNLLASEIQASLADLDDDEFSPLLLKALAEWQAITAEVGAACADDVNELGSAAVDYLMMGGYIVLGWMWTKMAVVAKQKILVQDDGFYRSKLATARFYFQKILPRTLTHAAVIRAGAGAVMCLSDDDMLSYQQ